MDWSCFRFDYRVGLAPHQVQALLVDIDGYRKAAHSLVLPPEWKEKLDRLNRIRAIRGTTGLEGNPLSEGQVAAVVEDEAGAAARTREEQQVRNADIAQKWVRSMFGWDGRPLTTSDILHMHSLMTTGSDETNNVPGQWRTYEVQVGTEVLGGVHRGAPYASLERLTADFVAFVNSGRMREEHPVVRALLAHFFLVTIHPFGDGNGRVSRLVEAAVLYQGGYNVHGFYGLSNFFYVQGDKYKLLLQQCRRERPFDVGPFVEFGLAGFASELNGINNFIQTKLNRLVYRDMMSRALIVRISERRRLLNEREHALLHFLLEETEPEDPFAAEPSREVSLTELVHSPFVRQVYRDVTRRTFRRELIRLAEHGFIHFRRAAESGDHTVRVAFSAIGRY